MTIDLENITDLSAVWDQDASRVARVSISQGRVEIVLCEPDDQWVRCALETLSHGAATIVVASPRDAA